MDRDKEIELQKKYSGGIADLSDEEFSNKKLINFEPTASIWTSNELLNTDFPEPQWIVDGLIPEGLTLLAGKPKTGKSWLALQIATSASVGVDVLGHFNCKPIGVVYLGLEDTGRRLKSRLVKLQALGSDNLKLVTGGAKNRSGIAQLEKYLDEQPNVKLVVIDTLAQFLPSFDFNSYSETYPVMSSLKILCDKRVVGILAIHHTRKSGGDDFIDAVTGSNAFTGVADTTMVLTRGRGDADGSIMATGRDFEDIDIALSLERDLGWQYLGDGPEYRMSREQRGIVEAIREAGEPIGPKDVAAMTAGDYGKVKLMMYRMEKQGLISKQSWGKYVTI